MLAELLEIILWSTKAAFFVTECGFLIAWYISVDGTPRKYVFKSLTKLMIYLMFLTNFIHGVTVFAITDIPVLRALGWFGCAVLFSIGGFHLHLLRKDGGDDFFSQSYRKAFRWIKNILFSTRRRHAYVKP